MNAAEVIKAYRNTGEDLINSILETPEDQFNTVPFTDSWTVGEVADHLRKSLETWLLFKGKNSTTDRSPDEYCKSLSDLFLNFELKFPTAEFIAPSAGPHDKNEMAAAIKTIFDEASDYADKNDLDLLCMEFEFPGIGNLTRLEWLHFYTVHTQRHIRQIKNILKVVSEPV
ncbi:DinB family protein [Pollutibacter soli]|uniref:DinB family protein n=1 Tax=Pollutibacter soli TaxID=3034157 RepID=UPI0030133BB1